MFWGVWFQTNVRVQKKLHICDFCALRMGNDEQEQAIRSRSLTPPYGDGGRHVHGAWLSVPGTPLVPGGSKSILCKL